MLFFLYCRIRGPKALAGEFGRAKSLRGSMGAVIEFEDDDI